MIFEHHALPFASSLFGVSDHSISRGARKKEILTAFIDLLPKNGTLVECFSGDGKNFFEIFFETLKQGALTYIGIETSHELLKRFKERLSEPKYFSQNLMRRCIFLGDTKDPIADIHVDGTLISRGGIHLLHPNEQRTLLVHACSVSTQTLLHCVLAKNRESTWFTHYHNKGGGDEAYRVAPLMFYNEIARSMEKNLSILELPDENQQNLYSDLYLLFS